MSTGRERFDHTYRDGGEHTNKKEVGGNEEDTAGFAHASEIDEGDDCECDQA